MGKWKAAINIISSLFGKESTKSSEEVKVEEETGKAIAKEFYLTKEEADKLRIARDVYDEAKKYAKIMDRNGLEALFGFIPYGYLGDIIPAVISSAYLIHLGRKIGLTSDDYVIILGAQVIDVGVGLLPYVGNFLDFGWKSNKCSAKIFKDCVDKMELEMMKRGNPKEDIQKVEEESKRVEKEINSYIGVMKGKGKEKEKIADIEKILKDIEDIIIKINEVGGLKEELIKLDATVKSISKKIEQLIREMTETGNADDANELKKIEPILKGIEGIIEKSKAGGSTKKSEKGDTTALEDLEGKLSNLVKGLGNKLKVWAKRKIKK